MIPLILSLTVHEWAHAWSAWMLGDDTAAYQGRMTLNPLAHMDPVGTFVLPLMGVPFGWAKPVPVNPGGFNRKVSMRMGILITAAAGPISNIIVALICMVLLALLVGFHLETSGTFQALRHLLEMGILLNIILAAFNMLPIPPLDGSRVLDALVPDKLRPMWDRFCQVGPIALAAVILLPLFMGFSLLQWPLEMTYSLLEWLTHHAS